MFSIKDWELLSFFKSDPEFTDPISEVPWVYNQLTYKVKRKNIVAEFEMAPSYMTVSLTLTCDDRLTYHLKRTKVHDVKYTKSESGEVLTIEFDRNSRLFLEIRPTFSLIQEYESAL